MNAGILLVAVPATPILLLLACLLAPPLRPRMTELLAVAPLPALAAAFAAIGSGPVVNDLFLLGVYLTLDTTGAVFLGVCALLWSAAGAYAATYIRGLADRERFSVFWLLTLAGNLGVFVSSDIVSFYLAFAMVSLPAYGLVVHDGSARAQRAGRIYLVLAVIGETCLLMGFMLAASGAESLRITDVVAALPAAREGDLTIGLLVAGFGLKAGLVPLHVWLPLAHPAAPTPASAVLSGAIIKAGIIGFIRFLPLEAGAPDWGLVLTVGGLTTAYFGVLVGITQAHPKAVLAYSSLSQMGLVIALLGVGLEAPGGAAAIGAIAAFYAAHHGLAKGALFLAVGVVGSTGRVHLWPVLAITGVIALGIAGLPLTGGALAKTALKGPLHGGLVETLAAWSAVGTALLMFHFLRRLRASAASDAAAEPTVGLVRPWLMTAAAAVIVPWSLYVSDGHDAAYAFKLYTIWGQAWPILLAAAVFLVLTRVRLPQIPEGDLVVPAERVVAPLMRVPVPALPGLPTVVLTLGSIAAQLTVMVEAPMRPFTAAGLGLIVVAAAMVVAMVL